MACKKHAERYMNIMAKALQMIPKDSHTCNQLFADQNYDEIFTFTKTQLDAYLDNDDEIFLNNLEKFLQDIIKETDKNRREIMSFAFCQWIDLKITYMRDENTIKGIRAYFSLFPLVPLRSNGNVIIGSLNTNYKETGICINPKFPVTSSHIKYNDEIIKRSLSNRDIFEGINGSLTNCSYIPYSNKNIVKNIILSDTFLNHKEKPIFCIAFSPISNRTDLIQLENQIIERDGRKLNGEIVKPIECAEELLERLKNDWTLAGEMNADIFFAPELLGTALSEENDKIYNKIIFDCSSSNLSNSKSVPILTILPSYWINNCNSSTIVDHDGFILAQQEKHIPFVDKKAHKIEALKEKSEWTTILLHIPNVHRIAVVICAEFLSDQERIQKFICGSLGATLLIVPSYSRGEQDFINALPGLKCYGTTIIWGNCCGAVTSKEKAIGGCGIAGTSQTITFGSRCNCDFTCQNIKACVFTVSIPLDFELSKTRENIQKEMVTHTIEKLA